MPHIEPNAKLEASLKLPIYHVKLNPNAEIKILSAKKVDRSLAYAFIASAAFDGGGDNDDTGDVDN